MPVRLTVSRPTTSTTFHLRYGCSETDSGRYCFYEWRAVPCAV